MAKSLRIRKGYSQDEIAIAYGYTQPYISMLERGARNDKDTRLYLDFLAVLSAKTDRTGGSQRIKRKRNQSMASEKKKVEFEVLTRRTEVAAARKALRKLVASNASNPRMMALGHQGHTWDGKAYYIAALGMWTVFGDGEDGSELWNTYGLGDPFGGGSRDMVCHLSVPVEGINRRIGAVYAMNKNDDVFILHRGKIGGGREGVGKSSFFEYYDGKVVAAVDGDRITEFALVGSLNSKAFVKDLRRFVLAVKEIKAQATL
jgi:transcriptional regulator with XRE-family HTH domain